jgi:hypothetical protein
MSDGDKSRQLQTGVASGVPSKITLGNNAELDISWLSEDQRQALLMDHARGMIDMNKRAMELGVDVNRLRGALTTLVDTTRQVAADGNKVTVKHEEKTSTSRTEVMMGNTDEAAKGKLSFGMDNRTMYLIAGAVAVVVLIAIMFGGR